MDDTNPTPQDVDMRRRQLYTDILVALVIVAMVVLAVIFGPREAPTFIYQAF